MSLRLALVSLAAASLVLAETPQIGTPAHDQPTSSTQRSHRIRFGGVYVGAGYSRSWGAFPYYGYYPGYWDYQPLLFPPVYAFGYYNGFAYGPNLGAVKIQGADKDAWVYLDGALAGPADKLKQMWLDPGAYDLELRGSNRTLMRKIYVLTGKTLKVTPEMMEGHP